MIETRRKYIKHIKDTGYDSLNEIIDKAIELEKNEYIHNIIITSWDGNPYKQNASSAIVIIGKNKKKTIL